MFHQSIRKIKKLEEKNYRPISITINLLRIYERIIPSQISAYVDNILSKYQVGFRQSYRSQECLLVLIEKWKKSLDKGCKCEKSLTDLSKAFNCLLHDLLIAKLHAYGFEVDSLRLIYSMAHGKKYSSKIIKVQY